MTKNILEWGWHTSTPNSSSADSDWKPAPTLLGGAEPDVKVAAWGDKGCQGCASDGKRGTTKMYEMERRILCFSCAVKAAGAENESGAEKARILKPYLLEPK
jgi:hypothetical protein